jgi:8-oxo-dGTP pyrophosphatase MutT (NUDIX family)
MTALVTAGGTRVPIDDVRYISNGSKGRFPWQIALALARRNIRVTVVGSGELFERVRHQLPANILFRPFTTYDQLASTMAEELDRRRPDLLFMAAAVSDYGPAEASEGKISSDRDELVIRLRKLPKILEGLRKACGKETFIVGFKLTSGAPAERTIAAAREQIARCRINMVVANDLSTIGGGRHPVTLVTPEGGSIPVDGLREEVAERIADFALMRADTTWCRSERVNAAELPFAKPAFERAASLLRLAQDMSLFDGTGGNVSVIRRESGVIWVTPRGARKAEVRPEELVCAAVDLDERVVRYSGDGKPSIDTSVQARLYRDLPDTAALLHAHGPFVIPDAVTDRPFPCGSREEAEEILAALATAHTDVDLGFAVELAHHGYVIGFTKDGLAELSDAWRTAKAAYAAHLDDIGESTALERLTLTPVFSSARIAGVIAKHPEGWVSPFLLPDERGAGIGPGLIKLVRDRRLTVAVHDRCAVIDYYVDRAFRLKEKRGGLALLEPPTLRDDLIDAATVCLWHPASGRIMLAKRASTLWNGKWCHAGGRIEPGETAERAALRELWEETVLTAPGAPLARHETFTANGGKAFRVTTFLHAVPTALPPQVEGGEIIEAGWFTIEEALRLPMGHGTKEIIRAFCSRMKK